MCNYYDNVFPDTYLSALYIYFFRRRHGWAGARLFSLALQLLLLLMHTVVIVFENGAIERHQILFPVASYYD